jgi:hypothetical protein
MDDEVLPEDEDAGQFSLALFPADVIGTGRDMLMSR